MLASLKRKALQSLTEYNTDLISFGTKDGIIVYRGAPYGLGEKRLIKKINEVKSFEKTIDAVGVGVPEMSLYESFPKVSATVNNPEFYLGRTEITQHTYKKVMGRNPEFWDSTEGLTTKKMLKGEVDLDQPDLPVHNLSYFEAIEFCNTLSALVGFEPCYEVMDHVLVVIYLGPRPQEKTELKKYEAFFKKVKDYILEQQEEMPVTSVLRDLLKIDKDVSFDVKNALDCSDSELQRACGIIIHPDGKDTYGAQGINNYFLEPLKIIYLEFDKESKWVLTSRVGVEVSYEQIITYKNKYSFAIKIKNQLTFLSHYLYEIPIFFDIRKNGYRLPTKEEWLRASVSGSSDNYEDAFYDKKLGDALDYYWVKGNSLGYVHPVGRKKPNALGFYDMFGNVFEYLSEFKLKPEPSKSSIGGDFNIDTSIGYCPNASDLFSGYGGVLDIPIRTAQAYLEKKSMFVGMRLARSKL